MQRIPNMNVAIQSCGEHQSVVGNSIIVTVRAQGVVKRKWKNCPSIITALKDGNSDVEDCNKREIFISPSSCGNLANSNLLHYSWKIIIQQERGWLVGCLERQCWERNLAMSVHVAKLQLASEASRGNPISIGAYPLPRSIAWYHSIGGEPVQRQQLAREAINFEVMQEI